MKLIKKLFLSILQMSEIKQYKRNALFVKFLLFSINFCVYLYKCSIPYIGI